MKTFHSLYRFMRRAAVAAAIVVFSASLYGCATPAPSNTFTEMTFQHLPKVQLLVSKIEIESTAPVSTQPPNIGHLFPTPPDTALRNWARDRLAARGTEGTARFTIVRAEALGRDLKTDTGLTGIFKKELSERYEAYVDAVITVYDRNGQRRAHVEAKAEHATTVREDATLAERRRIMYELVEKLMAQFNAEMDRGIAVHLRNHAL